MSRKQAIVIALSLIIFAALIRLSAHLPNATPIAALAFAGSRYLGRRFAVLLPLIALFLSDMFIGFYDWRIMLSVYGSFLLIGCLSWIVRKQAFLPLGFSVVGASVLFFLITNAAVWWFSPWYEKSLAGLLYSYTLGIPFMRNMMIGDVIYTAALVAVFEASYVLGALRNPSVKAV